SDGSSLRVSSPPSGNGRTSASATGGGGALLGSVSEPSATVNINPTVKAHVSGNTGTGMIAGDLWIMSLIGTNASAWTDDGSRGIVAVPDVDSEISGTDNNTAFIGKDTFGAGIGGDAANSHTSQVDGGGGTLKVGRNVRIEATSSLNSSNGAKSDSGGGLDFSHATASG